MNADDVDVNVLERMPMTVWPADDYDGNSLVYQVSRPAALIMLMHFAAFMGSEGPIEDMAAGALTGTFIQMCDEAGIPLRDGDALELDCGIVVFNFGIVSTTPATIRFIASVQEIEYTSFVSVSQEAL